MLLLQALVRLSAKTFAMRAPVIFTFLLLQAAVILTAIADHPPSNVRQACSVSQATYYLRWDAPSSDSNDDGGSVITNYTVQVTNGMAITTSGDQTEVVLIGGEGGVVQNVSGVETPLGFLTHFTQYFVRVQAVYGAEVSEYSTPGVFLTPPFIPSQLEAPDVQRLSPSELRLTWVPPTYVNGPDLRYTIRVIPNLGGLQIDAAVVRTVGTSVVLSNLCHGTHVAASIIPSSGYTTQFTQGITPEVDMPVSNLAPTNVTTVVNGLNMLVSWSAPAEDRTGLRYIVEVTCANERAFEDGLPCQEPSALDTPATSGTIVGLFPGRRYLVRVAAVRGGQRSAPACAVATAGSGAPPRPSLVTVTVTSSTSISIEVQNGIDFVVAVHVRVNGTVLVFSGADIDPSVVPDLTPATTYQVEVAVQNFESIGPFSQPIILTTHANAALLNSVQDFVLHYPKGSDPLSVYFSWKPPTNSNGILGYVVYLNGQEVSTSLNLFYEFSAVPDTVYTVAVCYRGSSSCYQSSAIQFELTQDFVNIINSTAYRLSRDYTVQVVPINSSSLYVFFSPPIDNCNGLEHLSQSGFISDLAEIEPSIPLPPLSEGTQVFVQTGLNSSTQYFFYALKLRANYTKTISGQRLAGARTMDAVPSATQCPTDEVNGVEWTATSGNQNSVISFEREGCPVVLVRYCSSAGQWGAVQEQLNPCSLVGSALVPPGSTASSPPGSTTPSSGALSAAGARSLVVFLSWAVTVLYTMV